MIAFSKCLSTYDPNSEISRFNQGTCIKFDAPYFYPLLEISKILFDLSHGAFDPTLMPVIQLWSKAKKAGTIPDSTLVDESIQLVGLDKIHFTPDSLCKLKEGVMLNFNAVAPGYSVDLVAEYLEMQGIEDFMVEIGGEVRCKGLNAENKPWTIGIEDPLIAEQQQGKLKATVQVVNRALATSGNYRNYNEVNGKKYGHTLNPKTGYPAMQNILSATVLAPDAATADGLATICMVLGLQEALPLIESIPDADAFFIYSTDSGEVKSYYTPGLKSLLEVL